VSDRGLKLLLSADLTDAEFAEEQLREAIRD
jgi:hypothetical protein